MTYAGRRRRRRLVVTHTQLIGRVRRFTCQESHNFLIVATRTSNQNPFVCLFVSFSLFVCCCFGLPFCRVNPRGFGSAPTTTTTRGVPTRTTTSSKLTTNELIACNYFTPLCPSVFSCCVFLTTVPEGPGPTHPHPPFCCCCQLTYCQAALVPINNYTCPASLPCDRLEP